MKYKPPWHLSGKPYDVQVEGMRRVRGHDRFGFWCSQGLGKTALTINDYIENFSEYDTVFVICPNTFKQDWVAAPGEWGVPAIRGSVWPYDDFKFGTTDNPHFNVMNFEAVRSSGYDAIRDMMDKRKCALICDESSAIKNFKSQTARAVLDLSKRTKTVRLLNGTPMSQNVMDLFPQLKVLGELSGMNPYVFRNRFAVLGGFMGKQVVGVKNEQELQEIQLRCSFRALKEDWSDLPEKIYIPLRLEMTDRQRRHYKEMLTDFITIVNQHEFTSSMVLGQMEKLRQLASGCLMDGDKFELLMEPKDNPKIKAALDLMEAGDGKMILVHFYSKMGTIIYDFMKKKGLNPSFIRGGMKPDEIKDQKVKFNTDPSCRIKIAQIDATHLAHTLLGGEGRDRAHKMFFHDGTWNLKVRQQMEDRFHRGVQDRACLYYDPVLSPIDDAQRTALLKKADLVSLVVDAVRALR